MKKDFEKIINNLYKTNGFYPSFKEIENVLKPFNFKEEELLNMKETIYKDIVLKILSDKNNIEKIIKDIKVNKMYYPSLEMIVNVFNKIDYFNNDFYKSIGLEYRNIISEILKDDNFLLFETEFFKTYKGFYISPDDFINVVSKIEFITDEYKKELKEKYKKLLISFISSKDNINKILVDVLSKIGHYPNSIEFEQEPLIKEILKLINEEQRKKIGLFLKMNFPKFIIYGDNYKKIVRRVFEDKGKFALSKNLEKIDEWKELMGLLDEKTKEEFDDKLFSYMIEFISLVKNVNKGRKLFYDYVSKIPNKITIFAKLHYRGDFENEEYQKFGKDIGEGIRGVENDLMKSQEGGRYSFGAGKTSEAFWKFRFAFLPGIDKFL